MKTASPRKAQFCTPPCTVCLWHFVFHNILCTSTIQTQGSVLSFRASFLSALNIHFAQHPSRTPCHGVKKKHHTNSNCLRWFLGASVFQHGTGFDAISLPRRTQSDKRCNARVHEPVMSPKSNATACRNYGTERLHDACCWFEVSRTRGTSRSALTVELQRRSSWYFDSCFLQSTMCPIFLQNASRIENCVQTITQTVAAQTTEITKIEQIVERLLARVTILETGAASGSGGPDSARSWNVLGQSDGSTATGFLGSHGPGSSDDNRNTRRGLDTFSSHEDEHARSAVLLQFPCEPSPTYQPTANPSGFIAKKVRTCQTRIRDES